MKKILPSLMLVIIFLFSWSLPLIATDALTNLERAFLLNQASLLKNVLPANRYLNISFPAPLSISNNFSSEQSFLIFNYLFSRFKTLEFYSIHLYYPLAQKGTAILRARWSFQDRQTNKRYALDVYFFLKTSSMFPALPENTVIDQLPWKIQEIKGLPR
ncbi:MAG TPA: hypothetical protein ENF17_04455 [Candidatus Aminicenantes bacterium]|nr:hypothetical protein [Candidatus Aminicenantes bacterium]